VSLFYCAIVRTMTESALIAASRWDICDGSPMNVEAEELCRRWGESND
jgi:hypothetical protein